LKDFLRHKQMLLLLDNFEQVAGAGPRVTDLLAECPELTVLITSRAALNVSGEHQYAVPPLSLPDPAANVGFEELAECEAVDLFTQRAQEVRHDFTLNPDNAPVVAEICRQLDALPLAIELAAARIKLLPPQALLARMSSKFQILTNGSQDAED